MHVKKYRRIEIRRRSRHSGHLKERDVNRENMYDRRFIFPVKITTITKAIQYISHLEEQHFIILNYFLNTLTGLRNRINLKQIQ